MMADTRDLSEILYLQSMMVLRMNLWSVEPGGSMHTAREGARDVPRSSHRSILSGSQDWSARVFGDPVANSQSGLIHELVVLQELYVE